MDILSLNRMKALQFAVKFNGDLYRVFFAEDGSIERVLCFPDCKASFCQEVDVKTLPDKVQNQIETFSFHESK